MIRFKLPSSGVIDRARSHSYDWTFGFNDDGKSARSSVLHPQMRIPVQPKYQNIDLTFIEAFQNFGMWRPNADERMRFTDLLCMERYSGFYSPMEVPLNLMKLFGMVYVH